MRQIIENYFIENSMCIENCKLIILEFGSALADELFFAVPGRHFPNYEHGAVLAPHGLVLYERIRKDDNLQGIVEVLDLCEEHRLSGFRNDALDFSDDARDGPETAAISIRNDFPDRPRFRVRDFRAEAI